LAHIYSLKFNQKVFKNGVKSVKILQILDQANPNRPWAAFGTISKNIAPYFDKNCGKTPKISENHLVLIHY
jgi:hypothetical protein